MRTRTSAPIRRTSSGFSTDVHESSSSGTSPSIPSATRTNAPKGISRVTLPGRVRPTSLSAAKSWKGSGCVARRDSRASPFQVSNWRKAQETRCPIRTTSSATSKRCQASSGYVMKPTPGKTGWAGPSSRATNTPNDSIAAMVPERIASRSSPFRNAQSSGCAAAAMERRTTRASRSTAVTSAVIRRPTSRASGRASPQGRSSGPTDPSAFVGNPSRVTAAPRERVTSVTTPPQRSPMSIDAKKLRTSRSSDIPSMPVSLPRTPFGDGDLGGGGESGACVL